MIALPQTPSFRLDGKRALVTGASSGIGLACAAALAQAGAQVTLVARRGPELNTVMQAILAQGGDARARVFDGLGAGGGRCLRRRRLLALAVGKELREALRAADALDRLANLTRELSPS